MFTTTRQKIFKAITTFHTASYPTMEVNLPKKFVTDVETISDPFVKVELDMRSQAKGLPVKNVVRVSGELVFNHYVRAGAGMKVFTDYSTAISDFFALETVEGVTFYELQTYDGSGIPGFDGVMNTINYEIDYFNV